jgi:hypothetical protein
MFPADIALDEDAQGRLVARRRDDPNGTVFATASVAYTDTLAAGLAVFGPYAGIVVQRFSVPARSASEALSACARETIARAVCPGRTGSADAVTIRTCDAETGMVDGVLGAEFPERAGELFRVSVVQDNDYLVATTFRERTP